MTNATSDRWIDAHHHLWHYHPTQYPWMDARMDALRRDFTTNDLIEQARPIGVVGSVAVQARQSLAETAYLLDVANREPFVLGVVGWVPLVEANVEHHLSRFAQHPLLKGVRHVLHDEADPDYMLRADFNHGISCLKAHNLAYDLLIFASHLPQTLTFVDRHPEQRFVVDHIAKPDMRANGLATWRPLIRSLAERENVVCKLSGMVTEADWERWDEQSLRPYFETVLEAFGPNRLIFGSDWPVLNLASPYPRWLRTVSTWLATLSPNAAEAIRFKTAVDTYQLDVGP